jgi:hypothetical protein
MDVSTMSNTRSPESERQSRQKERGLWNFLTWSFFLSQVLAEGQYTASAVASGAHAEETSEHSDTGSQLSTQQPMGPAIGSGLAGGEGSVAGEPLGTSAATQLALANVNAPDVSAFAPAKAAGDTDARQSALTTSSAVGHVGSGGGEGRAGDDAAPPAASGPNTPDDPNTGGGCGLDLPGVLAPVGSGVVHIIDDLLAPPISAIDDLVEDLTDPLTQTIDDLMSSVPVVTSLLEGAVAQVQGHTVTQVIASATEVLENATTPLSYTVATVTDGLSDLIGSDKLTGGGLVGGAVSAAGQILFEPLSIGGDLSLDLFSGDGKYTDYNLALHTEHGDTQGHASAASASSSTLLDKLLTPDVADASHPQGDSHSSPTPVHVIDDIGRGLSGDWLSH